MKNRAENGRNEKGRSNEDLATQLPEEVKKVFDTMQEMGISNGATVGRMKGVFPSLPDRAIDRILGNSARKMGTALITPENIARVVIGASYSGKAGTKPFEKALDRAIKDEKVRRKDEEQRQSRETVVYAAPGK